MSASVVDSDFYELSFHEFGGSLDSGRGLEMSYVTKIAIKIQPETLPRYSCINQLDKFLNLQEDSASCYGQVEHLRFLVQHTHSHHPTQIRSFNPDLLSKIIHWLRIFWRLKELSFVSIRLPESEIFSFLRQVAGFCPTITTVILNGRLFDPKSAVDFQLSRMPFYDATTSHQPKTVFMDLVDDVLLLIFRELPPTTLYSLASVSRRIQLLTLSSYLGKYKISTPFDTIDLTSTGSFSHFNELDALSGLLISVFIKNITTFTCKISHKGCTYFSLFHVDRLERFFSRLDSCKKVKIEFESSSSHRPHDQLTKKWEATLIRLLDVISTRGCEKLEIVGGGCSNSHQIPTHVQITAPPVIKLKSPTKLKRISRILPFLGSKPAESSTTIYIPPTPSELPLFGTPFYSLATQPRGPTQGTLRSLSISTRSGAHFGEFVPSELSPLLARNPSLTHLTFTMAGRSLHPLAGSVPALTHLEISGHSPTEGIFEFLRYVPLLRRLKLDPSLQPRWEDMEMLPRFNLPRLEVIHSPSFYIAHILTAGIILPNLRSITIVQQPFSMIPYLPTPSDVKAITERLLAYRNPPELVMEINLCAHTIWMPHELSVQRITNDVWPDWLASVSGLTVVVLRGVARFSPSAPGVILLVLALFPGLKHLHIFTETPLPTHLTAGHFHHDLIKSIHEKFPSLETLNVNRRPFSTYLTSAT
ncbi:hypothetical protein BDN72DRAFT_896274 [Pluteus cervinus]|uniref:Uncharacterized protein n=1 Tax=Pluteus cervinus TaxID=181527 RepID=A0ACD3AZA0_9AGAR|nr:hypothetical protein BDN72DRAFT_896274 [Pluteus cervinus]